MKILKQAWSNWKKIAHRIGVFQSRVLLSLFFVLIFPVGIVTRFVDLLGLRKQGSTWEKRSDAHDTLVSVQQQF